MKVSLNLINSTANNCQYKQNLGVLKKNFTNTQKAGFTFLTPSHVNYRKQLFVSQECEHLNKELVPVVFQDNVFILNSSVN